ncbi:hypothetical protein [Labrys sp. KNU-23]|nr:hypothetical protein [Labrys sp. KNU-23]
MTRAKRASRNRTLFQLLVPTHFAIHGDAAKLQNAVAKKSKRRPKVAA